MVALSENRCAGLEKFQQVCFRVLKRTVGRAKKKTSTRHCSWREEDIICSLHEGASGASHENLRKQLLIGDESEILLVVVLKTDVRAWRNFGWSPLSERAKK
jgi:hypothetical protein